MNATNDTKAPEVAKLPRERSIIYQDMDKKHMSKWQYKPENPHSYCTKIKLALVSVSSVIRQTLSADWWSTPSPDDYSSKHEVSFCAHLGCCFGRVMFSIC